MGLLEGVVAIMRNGACVLKSLLPDEHIIRTYKYQSNWPYKDIAVIDLWVGTLQLAAAVFSVIGGLRDFVNAWKRISTAYSWIRGSISANVNQTVREFEETQRRLKRRIVQAWNSLLDAILRLVVGVCFFYLFLSTTKHVEDETLMNWVGIVMLVALAIGISKASLNIASRRAAAASLLDARPSSLSATELAPAFLDYTHPTFKLKMGETTSWYSLVGLHADLTAIKSGHAKLEKLGAAKDGDELADAKEILHRAEKAASKILNETFFESVVLLMDIVAFWGYFVYPLIYFFPDEKLYRRVWGAYPGHNSAMYYGGLVGDLMWTIQPFFFIFSSAVLMLIGRLPTQSSVRPGPQYARLPARPASTSATAKVPVMSRVGKVKDL